MAISYTHVCDFTDTGIAYIQVWQHNYGHRVELIGTNLSTSLTVQWHYNGVSGVDSRAITAETTHFYSLIPNDALLQEGLVEGYIYDAGVSIGTTVYKIELTVRKRYDTTEAGSEDTPPDTYFVISNPAVTPGTYTKITYDSKGLITSGGDVFAGYTEPVSAPTGTSRELDTTAYNVFDLKTFTAETTITFKTPGSGTRCYSMTLFITQSASPQTINLPTIKWNGGSAPTLTDASTYYIIALGTINNGTTWFELGRGEYNGSNLVEVN